MLQIFTKLYDKNKLTILKDKNEYQYFNANECCKILGYIDVRKTLKKNVKTEYKIKIHEQTDDINILNDNNHTAVYLKEPGFYQQIMKSKMELAINFQNWVYEEVLPSIRKNGSYKDKKYEDQKKIITKLYEIVKKNIDDKKEYIYVIEFE